MRVIGSRLHAIRVTGKMLNVVFDINAQLSNTQHYINGLMTPYLWHVTSHLWHVTSHLWHVTSHLWDATLHPWQCNITSVTCNMTPVASVMLRFTCVMSQAHVACHILLLLRSIKRRLYIWSWIVLNPIMDNKLFTSVLQESYGWPHRRRDEVHVHTMAWQ